ncbi:triple tyrosine motif-containing protein [Clostridium gasigenes]|uniref:triple tyrosine motif-containing protein n=1 Tax=Clostridium gasigenes TaxID=94869 RepID=UPI001C0C09F6|nr:triple tyrosine motif-containing protein [Clostridium gasigenes]MBU3108491.1 triple tyrosine motif-containing protein [Clostridium gasigenes]
MSEVLITFDKNYEGCIEEEINIKAIVGADQGIGLQYKFIEGTDGIWNPIQDFSSKNICLWKPQTKGKHIIMVQAKNEESSKPFDHLGKVEFIVKTEEEEKNMKTKIIEDISLDKTSFNIGEKIRVAVKGNYELALYRFWIKGKQGWEALRDYSRENKLVYTASEVGTVEILIESKMPESENNVDEFTTIRFKVVEGKKIEIIDFECLTESILVNEELIFKVITNCDSNRNLLYKFLKIDKDGKTTCIQEYSSRTIISFKEKEWGEYRLLCLTRDMFSNKEFDDRAIITYEVKPYEEVYIKNFSSNLNSPQVCGTEVMFKVGAKGGRELLYRYIIEGPNAEDTGYIRDNTLLWVSKAEGEYKIIVKVKDISYEEDYEDIKILDFEIDKKSEKPVKIVDIITSKNKNSVILQPVNIKIKAEGGTVLKYSFIVFKDGKEMERVEYGTSNWVNFTPEEKGEYEVEVRVLDKYSLKEYDSHSFVYLKVKEYIPAEIDYILAESKETYLVLDTIDIEAIVQNTRSVKLKYITKINGHEVEDTGYINARKLKIKPKCPGKYTFEIFAKNIKCEDGYDNKKEISIYVHEAVPINSTKIETLKDNIKVNEEVTFQVSSIGGKEVCYEFYIMEKGQWVRAQEYSRKNYYTFLPFSPGEYRVLVLSKSYYKKVNYEDYDKVSFKVC